MTLRKISPVIILLSLLTLSLRGQPSPYGLPFIRNYHSAEMGGSEQNWSITQDHRGLIYVGNEDKGILEFDGARWRSLPVRDNLRVLALITGEDGVVYAGLNGGFGRLEPDETGGLRYRSLLDSLTKEEYPGASIWKAYYQDNKVYFCSMENIFVFDPASGDLSVIPLPKYAFFSFFLNSELYTSVYGSGLMKYEGDRFIQIPGGSYFSDKNISGLVNMDPDHYLVSTIAGGLFLLNRQDGSIDSSFVNPALKADLSSSRIFRLIRDEKHIYIGTSDKGVLVLNEQGDLNEIISMQQGMLDNTIAHIYLGAKGREASCLWVAHFKGVSRLDLNSPFRIQSVGPGALGMDGRGSSQDITDVAEFGGDLIIANLGGINRRPTVPDRNWNRNMRGIREAIFDLQVVQPAGGKAFLLASGLDRTYVIDQQLKINTLPVGGRKILYDPEHPSEFYTGTSELTGFQYKDGAWYEFERVALRGEISQLCYDREKNVWISTRAGLFRLARDRNQDPELTSFGSEQGLPEASNVKLFNDPLNQELLVGTPDGFYRFNSLSSTFATDSVFNSILPEGKNNIMALHRGANQLYWFSFQNEYRGWSILVASRTPKGFEVMYDRPFRALPSREPTSFFYTDAEDQSWFAKSNQLIHFDESLATETEDTFNVLIRNVSISGDSVLFNGSYYLMDPSGHILAYDKQSVEGQPSLKHIYRDVEFTWSAPYYKQEYQIRYSYFLEGFSSQWSDWSWERSVKINNLKHGRYVMLIKARNAYEDESPTEQYAFSILRPWYATVLAIFIYVILLSSLIVFVILYTRKLKSRAELLEKQNKEIELQKRELQNLNDEVTSQRDEIEAQRDSISKQKELIDQQNRAMTDSIHYARRIQDAVMPAPEVMRYLLPKHFVFYRPRDIVSGDFFWVDKRDETVLIAVADCTGHGVPGAFMSMLGISLLNEISSKYGDQPTNELMDELRDQLIAALGQTGDKYEARDGMEMALVAINTKTREVQFTGANHHLYTFQKGKQVIIKGDPMPVGIHAMSSTLFSAHSLKLGRGDSLYLFSDGYADQFGGEGRKKFGSARLKTLLKEIQQNIMHDQKEALEKEFDDWKGKQEQIDDVLMIGIKL